MVRHVTTLILGGILGSMVLAGNAEACWKKNCRHTAPVCATPVVCVAPTVCPAPPVVCVRKVACCNPAPTCAPKVKCCKITLPKLCLPKLCLPKFCHRKPCAPVVVACATPVVYTYPAPSPQASAQH
jgi:hypothetical protein